MIDLILTSSVEGPASLFTRNFRIHAGIPLGLYEGGLRSPIALVYGDISEKNLREYSEIYPAIIAVPSLQNDEIPEYPCHYETMTVKAPILAKIQQIDREGFSCFIKTSEGGPLVYEGYTGNAYTLIFAADIIKATIRILSGELEEKTGTDRYGRHNPLPESVIYAPAVSFHFNLLESVIRYIFRKLHLPLFSLPRWPASASMAIFLSHDVDMVKKWTAKRIVYELLLSLADLLRFRGGRFVRTIEALSDALKGYDPYWNFDELLFLEGGNGFKSTWFFAPFGGEYSIRENDIDPVYHRKPSEITAMIRRIVEDGCELALHGTRGAFRDVNDLKRQLESFECRLGFRLAGVRHHYLMFRHGKTLEAAVQAGLMYDATLGFSDRPGFRNGMASPYFPYPLDHPAGKILEIPLNFMDSVFLHSGGDQEMMKRRVHESYLYARAAGGLFSVLIHPGNMDPSEIPGLAHFYHSFIPRCRLDRARAMTGAELAHWWTTREKVLRALEYAPDMWRIKGLSFPEEMDFSISAPNITSMKFTIEGARGATDLSHDTLTIRPGQVDPEKGITFVRKR
ncbi:hypothetical protein LLG96_02635 [bacterium]|nr:hypothetical protein [bacterium]